jgi:hypothetical protein
MVLLKPQRSVPPFSQLVQLCNAAGGQDICGQGVTLSNPSFKVFASVETAVVIGEAPKPSTWAMMLLGFASLGYVGYRRRGVPARA